MSESPVTTQWIDITSTDGQTFNGYLALPPGGSGPGIVLIQEIFGVNRHIRSVAEQYAQDGYVVLAPDVFWRQEPGVELAYDGEDMDKARKLVQQIDFSTAVDDLACATQTLRHQPQCEGEVAAIGYCMGGILAYLAALGAGVDRAASFYPGGIANHLDKAAELKVPVQFHFAGNDSHITGAHVEQTRAAFSDRDDVAVFVYDGAEHGFNCWARNSYQRHAAALSHGRVLSFLESGD
ncbi:MAG: carboxymethylenebutenolidase [Alteromonadaceae bacterium]|mgnify:CR=1 FL=1|uniref:dienelactone hydrolase family protein n=1 Tax=Marinobacter sp. V034 TaxID=3459610 RepID=UPI000C5A6D68|nr:carboxymethylenebutenolidase [Alteromonadaceae bacterium]MBH86186.1 carboxymethylenebutenolidase [Alteromonadaceae bacterium]|tara:strand:+ start:17510 stop:18220 length:711 start_codon:yes stop_codon:yes gene_type:complete